MKTIINFNEFVDAFRKIRPDNFSYDGLKALFEYLEEYEEDTGTEIEFDVIALCCDYTEYKNLKEFQEAYGEDYKDLESIQDNTALIKIDEESFIIQNF